MIPVIVSLTSWKERIEFVSKTIFSVAKYEPYKIVLCLSIDEFPRKEEELPNDLKLLAENQIVEILWIKENVKCFKKILFTMDKYKDYPIVSADDDCIYTENYVKLLYEKWVTDKSAIWTYKKASDSVACYGNGPACLYPPNCFKENGLKFIKNKEILHTWHDDIFYGILAKKMHIPINQACNDNRHSPYVFHDERQPLSKGKTVGGIKARTCCLKNINL